MSNCCVPTREKTPGFCPVCEGKGKAVSPITVQAMTEETVAEESSYYLCLKEGCQIAYFTDENQHYTTNQVKVPIYPKDPSPEVPVCYCFGWTRQNIQTAPVNPLEDIKEKMKTIGCNCKQNNPQGSCCLGNVTAYLKSIKS